MSIKCWSFAAFGFVVVVILVYGGFLVYSTWPITNVSIEKIGVFGDSFGLTTSLFSGLAFAGIVITILMQKNELELQREELSLTRKELRLARDDFQNQHITIKRQNFENTFFQLLRLHNDIVNTIDLRSITKGIEKITTGRDCFVIFIIDIRGEYSQAFQADPDASEVNLLESAYENFWSYRQSELGHYFRYLYTIFKFIKESEIENKKFYTNIVRAQLSDQELIILFYNCLYKFGVEKFKPIVEEFSIFDNLPKNKLLNIQHQNLFSAKAFGKDPFL